jgi:hypothetical protein
MHTHPHTHAHTCILYTQHAPPPPAGPRLIGEQREMRLGEMKRMFPTLPSKSGKVVTSGLAAPPPAFGRKLGRPVGEAKKKGSTFDPRQKVCALCVGVAMCMCVCVNVRVCVCVRGCGCGCWCGCA